MSEFRILRARDRGVTPWKNGQGWTAEAAVYPDGATLDNFEWRISFAGTDVSSAFSLFPGVDRTLAVLEGRIELTIDGRTPIELSGGSLPVFFPGDVPTSARLIEGPLRDLNVMTRRGRFIHEMQRLEAFSLEEELVAGDVAVFERLDGSVKLVSKNDVAIYSILIKSDGRLFKQ